MSRLTANVAATVALALCALAATPAAALEAGCLWTNLAESKRSSLLADYRARGAEALQNLQISEADIALWPARCGVTEANGEKAGMLLGTVLLERGAIEVLQANHGIKPAALATAWAKLDPAAKAKARASVVKTLANNSGDNGGADAIVKLGEALGLPQGAMRDLALYVFAILARDVVTAGGT
jgi:hypothetical protein